MTDLMVVEKIQDTGSIDEADLEEWLKSGCDTVSKRAVAGIKGCRTNGICSKVVASVDAAALHWFVYDNTEVRADDATTCTGMIGRQYETCKHSVGEWVNGMTHTNEMMSFWNIFQRAYHWTYRHLSKKHLNRYAQQFAGKHNVREIDTLAQIQCVVIGMVVRRIMYRELLIPSSYQSQ